MAKSAIIRVDSNPVIRGVGIILALVGPKSYSDIFICVAQAAPTFSGSAPKFFARG